MSTPLGEKPWRRGGRVDHARPTWQRTLTPAMSASRAAKRHRAARDLLAPPPEGRSPESRACAGSRTGPVSRPPFGVWVDTSDQAAADTWAGMSVSNGRGAPTKMRTLHAPTPAARGAIERAGSTGAQAGCQHLGRSNSKGRTCAAAPSARSRSVASAMTRTVVSAKRSSGRAMTSLRPRRSSPCGSHGSDRGRW